MTAGSDERDYETELAELLCDLAALQEEMLEVLARKRERMASGDLEGMTSLQPQEQQLCHRLEACHQRRANLLEAAANDGLQAQSIEKLASLVDSGDAGDLRRRARSASSRMRLLQHHCLTNWVVAQRSLLHLSQILEIVATGGRLQPTYGKGENFAARGALVDQEA